jgi:carboxyl-terminal processing protease
MKIRKIVVLLAIVVLGGIAFFSFTNDQKNFEIAKNLDIYYSLFRELNTYYVDEINPGKLVKTSIDKMLESLDPYTNYIPESDVEDFRFMTTGEYAGIGALISKHNNDIVVAEPYEGFPAQKSGLKAGDIILEVEGKSTATMNTEDVSNLLKGPALKPVRIKIQRPAEKKPSEITVIREKITIDAVPYSGMLDNKTAYIRLSSFTENCGEEIKKVYLDLKKQYNPESLILDLRSNPGGLLKESVEIVNLFVPRGSEIVSVRGKIKAMESVYKAEDNPVDTTVRIAVLTNRGSASASEIVTGAIQDLDRGIVVGTRTFGKGLVQNVRPLSYNTQLKITTAKYYIPSGRCIQALDYSHRNEDGSVGNVPDSLISGFNTKNGRKVYDGGGVVPDINLSDNEISNLTVELVTKFAIFDFATLFAAKNPAIPQPDEFNITDAVYGDFVAFVKNNGFIYDSDTEDALAELIKTARAEKYYDLAGDDFKSLESKLKPDLEKDLKIFRKEISELLKDEIVRRYYYQKGAIRATLNEDSDIMKAKDVLSKPDVYAGYFKPGTVISPN